MRQGLCVLFIFVTVFLFGQIGLEGFEDNRTHPFLKLRFDVSQSTTLYRLYGTQDISHAGEVVVNNQAVSNAPVYRYNKRTAAGSNSNFHLVLHLTFYDTEKWCAGFATGAGVGYQFGLSKVKDLNSVLFEFPQHLFFRWHAKKNDYTFLAGYKYCYSTYSNGIFQLAFDINFKERVGLRFFVSPITRTYYNQFSNGKLHPSYKINELGVGFVF